MPDFIEATLQAIACQRARRLDDAETLLRMALEAEPDQPSALFLLGLLALDTGRPAEAAALLIRADQLRPHHRGQLLGLARAMLTTERADEALEVCGRLTADPALAEAHFLAGCPANALGRPADAIPAFQRALAADPNHAAAMLNLGNANLDIDQDETAEACMRAAVATSPGLAEAHASLGHLLTRRGRPAEAIAACQEAVRLQPGLAQAHWNCGVAHLLAGEFTAGWDLYEWRKRRYPGCFPPMPGPEWQGEPLDGRTILVRAEQGFGDTLQFARYLPLLAERGARVVLQCAGPLASLLQRVPAITVVGRGRQPSYDFWVDQMSLPRLFGTVLTTIPSASGYLTPDPALAGAYDAALPFGLRIGLCWAGNPAHHNDRRRSMPVSALTPIIGAGAQGLVSLQAGPQSSDLAKMFGIHSRSSRLSDFAATAALIAELDLVITVDTAVAHLAGALGIPTWLMLPHAPDWRWMLHRTDSHWYASMRLFRQDRPGDWNSVVERVAAALAIIVKPADQLAFTPSPSIAQQSRLARVAAPPTAWPSHH